MGFLIDFDRSLLHAWVFSFMLASRGDLYAIFVGFLIYVEIYLSYALVLSFIIGSLGEMYAICVGFLCMLRYACYVHGF